MYKEYCAYMYLYCSCPCHFLVRSRNNTSFFRCKWQYDPFRAKEIINWRILPQQISQISMFGAKEIINWQIVPQQTSQKPGIHVHVVYIEWQYNCNCNCTNWTLPLGLFRTSMMRLKWKKVLTEGAATTNKPDHDTCITRSQITVTSQTIFICFIQTNYKQ